MRNNSLNKCYQKEFVAPAVCPSKANKQARLVERKVLYFSAGNRVEEGGDICPKANFSPRQAAGESF